MNIYANAARGFFFPEMRAVADRRRLERAADATPPEIIKQAEVGVKYIGDRLSGTISALYTELNDRRAVSFVNEPEPAASIERVNIVSTESYGMEADFTFRLLDNLNVEGNVTWQEHEFTKFVTNFVESAYRRQRAAAPAEHPVQPRLVLRRRQVRRGAVQHAYRRHVHDRVESHQARRVRHRARWARATRSTGRDMTARVGIDVYNLLDDDGITEGSPRQDTAQAASGAYFVGRPVLPRRYTLRFTVDF